MFRIEIEIDTDNDAFGGEPTGDETARIMRDLVDRIAVGSATIGEPGRLRDHNGNPVGSYLIMAG